MKENKVSSYNMELGDVHQVIFYNCKENVEITLGNFLKTRRKHLKISVKSIAKKLHLSADTIKDLENDNFANMPGQTFVKGYLRSYARILDTDIEHMIHSVVPEQLASEQKIPISKFSIFDKGEQRVVVKGKSLKRIMKWSMALLIAVILWNTEMVRNHEISIHLSEWAKEKFSSSKTPQENKRFITSQLDQDLENKVAVDEFRNSE